MAYIVNNNFPDELLNKRDVNWQYDGIDHEHGVALDWTTEPPKEPGWYWAFTDDDDLEVVRVTRLESGGECWEAGCDYPFSFSDYVLWLGPLPMPELPKPIAQK